MTFVDRIGAIAAIPRPNTNTLSNPFVAADPVIVVADRPSW
jgi:hypothetical protein